jgi:DNA polymerase-1
MTENLLKRLGDPAETLYLIDISSFIFRAFYAIRPLTTKTGEPTNAVYGVASMLAKLADEAKPQYLSVVYDSKEPSFRKEIYTEYKANRSAVPEELIPQFSRIEELIDCMEIYSFRQSGVEADDLIATLTRKWCKQAPHHRVVIVSSDKDLMQLVDDRVVLWDTMNNKIFGTDEVIEKFGVRPDQIRDYLALVGDSSDNIPGVPSIGPKTASDLLKQFESLDGILKAAQQAKIPGKKGEVLKNNEKDARLSQLLATVKDELKVELKPEGVKYRFHVNSDCQELLRSLDFHSLLARWELLLENKGKPEKTLAASPAAESPNTSDASGEATSAVAGRRVVATENLFKTVSTMKSLEKVLSGLERAKEFAFDLETTSLNPREAKLCGIALCYGEDEAFYIPVGHQGFGEQIPEEHVLKALKPFLENEKYGKVGQNLKYDISVLQEMGIRVRGIAADTMVADYVLDPESRHNLQTLAATHLGYTVTTYEEVCGKGKDQISFDQVPIETATRYSAEDALIALRLWRVLRPKLEAEGLMKIFTDVDLPLVDILSRMEEQGVCIDVDYLKKVSAEFQRELTGIEEKVATFTKGPVNLNSPKQLAVLLFEELKLPTQSKTKTGYSTDAKVLESLAELHEVPRLLLEYREISKLKGTYVDTLPVQKDAKTGKIHAGFHQAVAATGRLSSSDPNLQNIPVKSERGRKIRRAFVASPGNVLLSADYSQIELRILAHMSGDVELSKSFQKEEDVHQRTASEIFDIEPSKVDDLQRGIAKAINFGLMYGKTAFGLAAELGIPRKEAASIIERYFKRYNGVKKYLDEVVLEAKETGYVKTVLGRKRPLRDIKSTNPMLRANAERMAMNSPIQGTAADLMKLAMIDIDRRLTEGGYRSKMTIQVHDEVLLDCPKDEVEKARTASCEFFGRWKLVGSLIMFASKFERALDS